MNTTVYQFLDDLGTQEFINTILEIYESNLNNRIVGELDGSAAEDQMPTSSACLTLVTQLLDMIADADDLVSTAFDDIDDLAASIENEQIKAEETTNVLIRNKIEFITGDIATEVENPEIGVLYAQHDLESDMAWSLYVYVEGKWICVGEDEYDLVNYWKKDETDELMELFYEQFFSELSDDEIKNDVMIAFQTVGPYQVMPL